MTPKNVVEDGGMLQKILQSEDKLCITNVSSSKTAANKTLTQQTIVIAEE